MKAKALNLTQRTALIERIKAEFQPQLSRIEKHQKAVAEAKRKHQFSTMFAGFTPAVRNSIIKAISYSPVVGVQNELRYNYKTPEEQAFDKALAELEFKLIMADNDTYEGIVSAFKSRVRNILK